MERFSIVIVVKNAADKIESLLRSVEGLTDDIILCDTGSTDRTVELAKAGGATVHNIPWEGYGKSKNVAIGFARYDWILSLDGDEKVDDALYRELKNWKPVKDSTVYQVLWKNFFAGQWIRHSDWSNQWKNRLFNKKVVQWDDAIAHEDIQSNSSLQFVKLDGFLEHYSFDDTRAYASKMIHSAMITAQKYHDQGKKFVTLKFLFSPLYSFIKSYFIKLGFLDGHKGWLIAVTSAYYTFIKYARLMELNRNSM